MVKAGFFYFFFSFSFVGGDAEVFLFGLFVFFWGGGLFIVYEDNVCFMQTMNGLDVSLTLMLLAHHQA